MRTISQAQIELECLQIAMGQKPGNPIPSLLWREQKTYAISEPKGYILMEAKEGWVWTTTTDCDEPWHPVKDREEAKQAAERHFKSK